MNRHGAELLVLALLACGPTTSVEVRPDPLPDPEPTVIGYLRAGFEDPPAVEPREGVTTPGAPVFTSVRGQIRHMRWSPRGDLIAAATTDHTIVLLDPRDGSFRGARRVHVRSNAFTELGYFDSTGTRLMIDIHGHSDAGIVAVWDLAADRWVFERRSTDRTPPSAVFVGERVAYYEPRDQSVHVVRLDTGAETTIEAPLPDERAPSLDTDGRFVLVTDTEHVQVVDPERGEKLGEPIEGRLTGVRPRGGLFAIVRPDGSLALVDPLDQSVRHEIPGPEVTAFFDEAGALIIDRGITGEGDDVESIERIVVNPHTREETARGTFSAPSGPALDDVGTIRLFRGDESQMMRGQLGEEPATFGEFPYVMGAAISPDRERVLVSAGRNIAMMSLEGEEIWRVENDMAGEASVWDVAPTPTGMVTWGRAGSDHWSGTGRVELHCAGQGWPFELEGRPGWATLGGICVGEDEPRRPPSEARIVGLDGDRYVALQGRALHHYELRNDRRRATYRLGRTSGEIYNGTYHSLGRGGVFFSYNGAWFVGRGAAQAIEPRPAMTSQAHGNHFAATNEANLTIYDASRRKVLELEDVQASNLAQDGATLAYASGEQVFVVSLPSGDEVMRIRPPEGAVNSIELRGDSLALVHDAESTIWHVPSVSQRVRFDARAPFVLDAAGTSVAVCEHARLTVRSTLDGTERAIGECPLAESVHFVANDTRVAVKSRTIVTLHRTDREGMVTLRTLRASDGSYAIAYDGEHLWTSEGALEHLRFRGAGPITAEFIDPASKLDPNLLNRFFSN